jgi:RNA polymerase sigma factor (sigma-70 family)
LLGHEADALDAVQNGFVKVFTQVNGFEGRSSFKTWLLRVVSNASLDLGRRRGRREEMLRDDRTRDSEPELTGDEADPARNLDRADLRLILNDALGQLPDAQRKTFVLHVDGELSYREVACDRTRLFPPGENWMNLLVLLLRAGLDPGTLARRFEYRAQLVALCEASEPRLALAQLLGESGSNGITPHHEAYAELLDDFLGVLEQGLMGEAETFAGIDLEYGLVHQLHHLTAQEVRRVGLGLARREFGTRPIP